MDLLNATKLAFENNSTAIIDALNQPELRSTEENDPFTIFYEKLKEVPEDQRDKCVKETEHFLFSFSKFLNKIVK